MITTIRVKLHPTKLQSQLMIKSANVMRFAYNWGLSYQINQFKQTGKIIRFGDLGKEFTKLRSSEGYEWLKEVSAEIPQQAIKADLKSAYDKFFKIQKQGEKYSKSKIKKFKLKNKPLTYYDLKGHPKFKSKKYSDLKFFNLNNKIFINKNSIVLEKIGWVKYSGNKLPICGRNKKRKSEIKFYNPRIKNEGKNWYLTIGIDYKSNKEDLNQDLSIGIDLGVKNLAIVSNIAKPFKNINKSKRIRKLKKTLKRLQKQVSRKYEMNNEKSQYNKTQNIIKLEKRIKVIYKKLTDIRKDYLHKVTNTIAKTKPYRIVLEDLNVQGMLKNKHLAEKIQEQCFNKFQFFMQYKAERRGIQLVKANRFYPSSKTCSCCGTIKKDLKLSDRIFTCECGFVLDRDKNASINLANYGLV